MDQSRQRPVFTLGPRSNASPIQVNIPLQNGVHTEKKHEEAPPLGRRCFSAQEARPLHKIQLRLLLLNPAESQERLLPGADRDTEVRLPH